MVVVVVVAAVVVVLAMSLARKQLVGVGDSYHLSKENNSNLLLAKTTSRVVFCRGVGDVEVGARSGGNSH